MINEVSLGGSGKACIACITNLLEDYGIAKNTRRARDAKKAVLCDGINIVQPGEVPIWAVYGKPLTPNPCMVEAVGEPEFGKSRDALAEKLEREYKVLTRKYFYPLLSDLTSYRGEHDSADTPVAKRVSDAVLTLPLFVDLTHEQVDYICDAIAAIKKA